MQGSEEEIPIENTYAGLTQAKIFYAKLCCNMTGY